MSPESVRVEISPEAGDDLEDIVEYISERNPAAGERIRAAIFDAITTLAGAEPGFDGRPVTMRTGAPCRRTFVHPAAIYYEREAGVLTVLRVYHHAREPIAR